MPECERLTVCSFFNDALVTMPTLADWFKNKYCLKNSAQCARYMALQVLGAENVPANLFPDEHQIAQELIAETRKKRYS